MQRHFEANAEGEKAGADLFSEQEPMLATCMAASIQYRIGLGAKAGQKVRRLETWRKPSKI